MVRAFGVFAFLLTLSGFVSAQTAPEADAAAAVRFEALSTMGDRARAAGRLREAAIAYGQALEVRNDPLVAGRLGLLLVEMGTPEQAAELLLAAIQRATQASPTERQAFFRAYEAVQEQGAWIEVVISHAGASVLLDGVARNRAGRSAFYVFVLAGKHEIKASLAGYQDAVVPFEAEKKKDRPVYVTLVPLPEAGPVAVIEPAVAEAAPQKVDRMVAVGEPLYSRQEDPYADSEPGAQEEKRGVRGSVYGGPLVVFGVATWAPAVGPVLGGTFKPNEHVSIGLEGRAAWVTSGVGGEPIQAMTAGGIASLCGHYRWVFGCAIGHLGVINIKFSTETFTGRSETFVKPGVGGRLGAKVVLARSFAVAGAVDVLGLSSGMRVGVGNRVVSETPPLMVGTSITGIWEF